MYVMCQLISATALDDINFIMVEVKSNSASLPVFLRTFVLLTVSVCDTVRQVSAWFKYQKRPSH